MKNIELGDPATPIHAQSVKAGSWLWPAAAILVIVMTGATLAMTSSQQARNRQACESERAVNGANSGQYACEPLGAAP